MIRILIGGHGVPGDVVETYLPAMPRRGETIFVGNEDECAHLVVESVTWFVDTRGEHAQLPTVDCVLSQGLQPDGLCEGIPFYNERTCSTNDLVNRGD